MIKKLLPTLFLLLTVTQIGYAQLRDSVHITFPYFEIMYSETKEQPLWVEYVVRQIEKGADRKGIDFYKEKEYHTSDSQDYYRNVWDKGHMAPAAHFSDTEENLRQTFTYLNSALQHKDLNRREWRYLEAKEREWVEEFGEMWVRVEVIFDDEIEKVEAGAEIPDAFNKIIWFKEIDKKRCFYFPNEAPTKEWTEYEVECKK